MAYAEEKHFDRADQFIDFFRSHPWLKSKHEYSANYLGLNGFVFRGQSDARWRLCPSAFRPNSLLEHSPQTAGELPPSRKNMRSWLGWHIHAELRAAFLFLEAADRLGIPTPIDYGSVNEHSELIKAAMNSQESDQYKSPFPNPRRLVELALAQHHGVPTRLLDWTESPYIASYFAAYKAARMDSGSGSRSERFAVFMLRTQDIHKYKDSVMIVNAPRHGNGFLRAQRGLFTNMPLANQYLLEFSKWPDLEDVIEGKKGLSLLKITLLSTQATNVLRILYDMDITRHSMMPTLDNAAAACKYVLRLFRGKAH